MGRRGHAAVFINSSLTGSSAVNFNRDDATADTYSCSASFMSSTTGTARSLHSRAHQQLPHSVEVPVNALLVFGGSGIEQSKYAEQLYNDLWSFSLADNCWAKLETTGAEPRPVFDHRMVVVQDLLVVIGGITGTAKSAMPSLEQPSHSSVAASDVMVLNLRTSAWSTLKIWDQFGQHSRFNFHGFSVVADSSNSALSAGSTSLFIFGGNQVVDCKAAALAKSGSPWAYPHDHTFVLNLRDCTLLPISCTQDTAPPEGRYGHMGVSCVPADQLFSQQQQVGSRDKPKKPEKAKTRRSLIDAQPEQQTLEPLMFVFGGAGVERGGYPDPLLFQLVRVRTEINESFLPSLTISPDPLQSDAATTIIPMLSQFGDLPGDLRDSSPFPSRPGSPSSFLEGLSSTAYDMGADQRQNIWHNLQTKVGHRGEARQPSNWAEMKLSLTAPFSQRVFETDRFENEAAFDQLQRSSGHSPSKWAKKSTSDSHRQHTAGMRSSQSAPVFGASESHLRSNTLLNSRLGSTRTGTANTGTTRSHLLSGGLHSSGRLGSTDSALSPLRPSTVSTLSHTRPGSGSDPHSHAHNSSGDEIRDRLRQERADRVHLIRATLQPIVRHKTKVAAREQYLRLFPVQQQQGQSHL